MCIVLLIEINFFSHRIVLISRLLFLYFVIDSLNAYFLFAAVSFARSPFLSYSSSNVKLTSSAVKLSHTIAIRLAGCMAFILQ